MYQLINTKVQSVLAAIPQTHVTEYDWLIQNLNQCAQPQYQARYKTFWRLGAARLSEGYCNVYFKKLHAAQANPPNLADLAQQLYATPTHNNGRRGLQYSFASKLFHSVQPTSPIYDSQVAAFYFFGESQRNAPIRTRIEYLTRFHSFLAEEYGRIIQQGLLAKPIESFRENFNPQCFTDQKIIDSLLWAFVSLLQEGGLSNGWIAYR